MVSNMENTEVFVSPRAIATVLSLSVPAAYDLAHRLGATKVNKGKTGAVRVAISKIYEVYGDQIGNAVRAENERVMSRRWPASRKKGGG
jgi:hypothetical protein